MSRFPFPRGLAGATTLLALLGAAGRVAAEKTFTLDEDPIRLGNRALEENRLPDAEQSFQQALAADYEPARAQYGLARVSFLEGRYEDAEAFFRTALDTRRKRDDEDYPQARAGLGLLLVFVGRTQEAALELEQARKGEKNLWEAQFGEAWLLLLDGKWDAAKRLLDEGAKKKGRAEGEDLYHYGMALYHQGKGEDDAAEREALAALSLNPSNPEFAELVGSLYEKRNALSLAIDAYERALASPGMKPSAPMLRNLGSLYEKEKKYNQARDRYLAAVQIDSTYAPVLKDLGDLFRRAKQYDRAAGTYLRYVGLEKSDVDALVGLAQSCLEIGQDAQALEAARAAMTLEGGRTDVRLVYARAALRSRDESLEAEAAGILGSLDDPTGLSAADWVALAALQTKRKQYGQASQNVQKALALDPKYANAHFQQGIIELSQSRPDAAVKQFEQAIAIDPDVAGYHLNLGIAQYQRQDLPQAIAAFRRTLDLRPDLVVSRLLLAQALAATDSIEDAAAEYQKILDAEPDNPKALRGLGYCRIRTADYARAQKAYQKANEIEPDNADGWAGLGNACLGLEQLDAAEEAFARAKRIDPANQTMLKGMELLAQARSAAGG